MANWLVVREGDKRVPSPEDPRLVEVVKLPDSAYELDAEHPTIFNTMAAQTEADLKKKYEGKLWPNGNYHLLFGSNSEDWLTPSLLEMMQD